MMKILVLMAALCCGALGRPRDPQPSLNRCGRWPRRCSTSSGPCVGVGVASVARRAARVAPARAGRRLPRDLAAARSRWRPRWGGPACRTPGARSGRVGAGDGGGHHQAEVARGLSAWRPSRSGRRCRPRGGAAGRPGSPGSRPSPRQQPPLRWRVGHRLRVGAQPCDRAALQARDAVDRAADVEHLLHRQAPVEASAAAPSMAAASVRDELPPARRVHGNTSGARVHARGGQRNNPCARPLPVPPRWGTVAAMSRTLTMVKKRLANGDPCPKCVQAQEVHRPPRALRPHRPRGVGPRRRPPRRGCASPPSTRSTTRPSSSPRTPPARVYTSVGAFLKAEFRTPRRPPRPPLSPTRSSPRRRARSTACRRPRWWPARSPATARVPHRLLRRGGRRRRRHAARSGHVRGLLPRHGAAPRRPTASSTKVRAHYKIEVDVVSPAHVPSRRWCAPGALQLLRGRPRRCCGVRKVEPAAPACSRAPTPG